MSSSDEFFDADNSSANEEAEKVVNQPPKAPGECPQPNKIRRPVTLGFEPKFDFLSIEDDGLMTPNSTVNSITADYTREMILSQNRRSQVMSNSNGQSKDSISSPNPSNSNKSSSIEREREKDEIFKRHSLESRYFSCSDFFETENGNFEFRRDDSIRSSLSSRPERKSKTPRKAPKRPPQPSLTAVAQNSIYRHSYLGSEGSSYISPILRVRTSPNGTQSEIRPSHPGTQTKVTNPTGLTRSHSNPKFRTLTFSNDLDLTQFAQYAKEQKNYSKDEHDPDSVEIERTGSNSKTARIQNWRQDSQANKLFEMQDQIDRRSISNSSSISSDHSSIASSASAMARKARSVKTLISKTFKKRRNKARSTLSLLTESSIESNCEYKIKDSRNFPKTSLRHLDNMKLHQVLHTTSKRTENSGIIVMKFNSDGNLLASAGKDSYVYVWVMNTSKHLFNTQNSRKSTEITAEQLKELENEIENDGPVSPVPLRKYFGHTDHVVDLSWSYKQSDNWLLSCSIDKSIRLWHVSKHETIALFKNQEIPKSILFHPKDNCKFIAGFLGLDFS
jgi:WD40 repeat protein